MSQTSTRRRFRLPRAAWITIAVVVLALGAVFACQMRPRAPKDPYRFGAVEQGDVTRSVSASGSLQALVTVDVGSQISGQVVRVLADFNDEVKAGQTLAVIDPQTFQSRVAQSAADIAAGEAGVRQAQATLANAEADFNRKKALVDQGIYAPTTLDQATAAMKVAQAQVAAARARVNQSRATLRSQQVDLGRTTISSPIAGVVVDRKVEPGQTVAASLQAPVLFTIAQDLSKVEVKISVDEADVGQVQEGQKVRFTVDAFPDDTFQGVVTQVRKQPTTEQNVVAYTVIAQADNPQRKLLPGMTANADIVIETRRNVMKVPSVALRWTPPSAKEQRGGRRQGQGAGPPAPNETLAEGRGRASGMRAGTVYVLRDETPVAIPVRVGATDGASTEILSRGLKAGDRLIVGGGPKARAQPGAGGPMGGGQVRVKM
ncbi:efflux RND transporter periplasmic adaptor subunit [Phenylobacterium sp.]|uniref:efflux RND transporter periplasmic adaptor subunit n=1 Tax=Phenylobacterium sp. TaxID=1871053 RepID=UPI002600861D|nr:efflux RND transporter periplasmic adaptor subunit [Phenylobacterium sp.]MBX3483119.1 efflux RND transporter periplasmic adaptor subunit [Phenylobacterium sp.]